MEEEKPSNLYLLASPKRTRVRRKDVEIFDLLTRSLDQRWQKYRLMVEKCTRRFSERSVHDLRVACRRMIGILDVSLLVVNDKQLRKVRDGLKKQLRLFSPLRDVQVMIPEVTAMSSDAPSIKPLLTVLLLREKQYLKRIRNLFRVTIDRYDIVMNRFPTLLGEKLATPALRDAARTSLRGLAATAFARCAARLQEVDPEDSTTIHRLRVSFKKFRYLVEILAPVLYRVDKQLLAAMQDYQTMMGEIQDADVLLRQVTGFARTHRTNREELALVHTRLEKRRTTLIASFLGSANTLLGFWRSV